MTLTIINLAVDLILFLQFSHISVIAFLRIRRGKNGLTPFLLLVSVALTALIGINIAYQTTILFGVMGQQSVMDALQGSEIIIRTVLMIANVAYFIAIRREAFAPLRRLTGTQKKIYRMLDNDR